MSFKRLFSTICILLLVAVGATIAGRRVIASSEFLIYGTIFFASLLHAYIYIIFQSYQTATPITNVLNKSFAPLLLGFSIGATFSIILWFSFFSFNSGEINFSLIRMPALVKFAIFAAFAAVIEEIVFRGILQGSASKLLSFTKYGGGIANVIQAVLFSYSHIHTLQFQSANYPLVAFLFGIILGQFVIKYKVLWISIGIHFAWDFLHYIVSGIHKRTLSSEYGIASGFSETNTFSHMIIIVCIVAIIVMNNSITKWMKQIYENRFQFSKY